MKPQLKYLKNSLEISRHDYASDLMAMWNVWGFERFGFVNGTTLTLESIRALGVALKYEASL